MNRKTYISTLNILLLLLPIKVFSENLNFNSAYIINGFDNLQPSGLTSCNGKLLFVSDKHENFIFELHLEKKGIATTKIFLELGTIPEPPQQNYPVWLYIKRYLTEMFNITGTMDWEGIACNNKGEYFLASEYYFSVLKIGINGTKKWIGSNLFNIGKNNDLFQKDNAYFEGITLLNSEILLAIEREPSGFMVLSTKGSIKTYLTPKPVNSDEELPNDFTGLDVFNNKPIVLQRNLYQICELTIKFTTDRCFSFKNIALSNQWGYSTAKYGLAEGLAIDDESIWIIIDNNGDSRLRDSDDHRSTLLKFDNTFNHKN